MNDGRISTRYAKALLLWADRNGCARETYDAACVVSSLLVPHSVELSRRLGDSVVPMEKKLQFVEELLGGSRGLLTLGRFMVRKERGEYLVRAFRVFVRLYERQEHILSIEVRSAQPISEAQRERLEEYMRREFSERIEPRYVVDSDLIGGFQLLVDGKRYDRSVRGELNRMASMLRG